MEIMKNLIIFLLFLIPMMVLGQIVDSTLVDSSGKTILIGGILGSLSIWDYILGFFFVFLTLIFKWAIKTNKGIKNNPLTPDKWDPKFWWEDNAIPKIKSVISSIIVVYLTFRFAEQIVGTAFSYFIALGVGLGLDFYIAKLKKMAERSLETGKTE